MMSSNDDDVPDEYIQSIKEKFSKVLGVDATENVYIRVNQRMFDLLRALEELSVEEREASRESLGCPFEVWTDFWASWTCCQEMKEKKPFHQCLVRSCCRPLAWWKPFVSVQVSSPQKL